jgi:hypothetical protein
MVEYVRILFAFWLVRNDFGVGVSGVRENNESCLPTGTEFRTSYDLP